MRNTIAILSLWLLPTIAVAQALDAFERLFSQSEAFSKAFPTEKVHLHFDNTSYYQGDTIWFKAYVVNADDLHPTTISKPLYVDLLDQMGNLVDHQVVKLSNGTGQGIISLAGKYFTGYYEVRAYTKWMLAPDEPQYFSRTFPIYRKKLRPDETRSIANYHMDKSMRKRPEEKVKDITARFFPEGGKLVKGLTSLVGIETLSEDSGWVDITGYLLSEQGERRLPVSTIHDGMGSFMYTPTEKPAQIELVYHGKSRKFTLPAAEEEGFVMNANVKVDEIDVTIQRSSEALSTPLALFIFSQYKPLTYVPISFTGKVSKHIRIPFSTLPAGVIRLAIVDSDGQTIADRHCFVPTTPQLQFNTTSNSRLYEPFQEVECKLRLTDSNGLPVKNADVSVSIRDGMDTDYRTDDESILTDLLLTSELKGYINRPGFYFADNTSRRRKMLDNLMLIRGWRRYNLDIAFGRQDFKPHFLPEDQLSLTGHVKSFLRGTQRGLGVTLFAQNDSVMLSSATTTDSLGNFTISIERAEGSMESLIQTRKDGKTGNRAADVMLFRQIEPDPRLFDVAETNPVWDAPVDTTALNQALATDEDYLPEEDVKLIDEVIVKAKRRKTYAAQKTEAFERDILAFYNIRMALDNLRDEGKDIANDFGYLLHLLNKNIDRQGDHYGTVDMRYSIDGRTMERFFFNTYINAIETAMLYTERSGRYSYRFDNDTYRATDLRSESFWDNTYSQGVNPDADTLSLENLEAPMVRCDVKMKYKWNPNKNYRPTKGLRYTTIQGYSKPEAFYAPVYPDAIPPEAYEDYRRTLYWNPSMKTNDNGEIIVGCYNNRQNTFLNVNAETIVDGKPAATTFISFQ